MMQVMERQDGSRFARIEREGGFRLINATVSNTDPLSLDVMAATDVMPWSLEVELAWMHPGKSRDDVLALQRQSALSVIEALVEQARRRVIGNLGQAADRDQKAALALNALNPDPAMANVRAQSLAYLEASATPMGMTAEELAQLIKAKRDHQAQLLALIDAERVTWSGMVRQMTSFDEIDALLRQVNERLAALK